MRKYILTILALFGVSIQVSRAIVYFTYTPVDSLYYSFNESEGTAILTGKYYEHRYYGQAGIEFHMEGCDLSGDFVVPETVEYEGKTYKVTEMYMAAFNGCHLSSLRIPETIDRVIIGGVQKDSTQIDKLYISSWEWYFDMLTRLYDHGYFNDRTEYLWKIYHFLPGDSLLEAGDSLFVNEEYVNTRDFVVPDGVEYLPSGSFLDVKKMYSLTIPASVKRISDRGGVFYFWSTPLLRHVIVYSTEPYELYSEEFTNISDEATLYVPYGRIDKYKRASGWREFKHILGFDPLCGVEIPPYEEYFTGIETTATADRPSHAIFDLQGRQLQSEPDRGLYIQDGKKVVKR